MAAEVPVADGGDGDPKEKLPPPVLTDTSDPLHFPQLTPSQFGISVQSFTPVSSNRKEKSRLAQLKTRRRSNIGARGSPETNSLIRFMARQRMKGADGQQTLELAGSSPLLPHVASTLRQKMAVFQSLMEGEEEGVVRAPQGDVSSGGGFRTTEHLSEEEKENHHPPSPAPNKRRRVGLGPPDVCEGQIREAPSRLTPQQQDGPLERQSPRQTVAGGLRTPPPLDVKLEAAAESSVTPAPNKKRKQVHFGVPLSPELFDRDLPPSTPLQRGGAPTRAPTPAGASALRSLLKTPQRNDAASPEGGRLLPDLSGASPQLELPRSRRTCEQGGGAYGGRAGGEAQIVFPVLDELDVAMTTGTELLLGTQLDLTAALCDESPTTPDPVSVPTDASEQLVSLPETDEQLADGADAPSRTTSRSRKKQGVSSRGPERSSRKRKLPGDGELAERSTRAAAKSASGKMKTLSAARCWTKEVNRSLYGSREYASKIPTLSPITEREAPPTHTGHMTCDSSPAAALTNEIQQLNVVLPPTPAPETPEEEPDPATDEGPSAPPEVEEQGRSEPDTPPPPPRDPSGDEEKSAQRKRRGRRSDRQQETGRGAADGHVSAGGPGGDLTLWQADFNVENVFKPVTTRGQRSVRRSLRNRSSAGGEGAGLAWLPQTPPTDAQEGRRRTCRPDQDPGRAGERRCTRQKHTS